MAGVIPVPEGPQEADPLRPTSKAEQNRFWGPLIQQASKEAIAKYHTATQALMMSIPPAVPSPQAPSAADVLYELLHFLESCYIDATNSDPAANAYSHVMSWVGDALDKLNRPIPSRSSRGEQGGAAYRG